MNIQRIAVATLITAAANLVSSGDIMVVPTPGQEGEFQQNAGLLADMLNDGTDWLGSNRWTFSGGVLREIALPGNVGRPNNFFGESIQTIARDTSVNVTLEVGRSQGGTLVGAFLPNGNQRLDLADIEMFPTSDPLLPTRSTVLIHEITERFASEKTGFGFDEAHDLALDAENLELADSGSRGRVGQGFRFNLPAFGSGDPAIYKRDYSDSADASVEYLVFTLAGDNDISDIRPGWFETGVAYNGSEKDISIASISVQSVPEPSPFVYMALCLVFLGTRWRANRSNGSQSR